MLKTKSKLILEPEAVKRLEKYGITYPEHGLARSVDQAVSLANEIGYPVVMKIISPDIPHKTDKGGVILDLNSEKAVRKNYDSLLDNVTNNVPGAHIIGVMICRQAKAGIEVIIGATKDPVFGMVLMFGLGGIFTELMNDVAFRSIPIEYFDAQEMVREIKGYSLLTGVRGQSACDLNALSKLLVSVSNFIKNNSDIQELDLNPVRIYQVGCQVLDARIIYK